VSAGTVRITPELVPYLRRGVMREMSATLAILTFQIDIKLDPSTYQDALARLDDARCLFDVVGVDDESTDAPLELDLDRYGSRLVLRALESEYDLEVMHLQDRAHEGFDLPLRQLPALGQLVTEIRERVGAPPKAKRRRLASQLWRRVDRRGQQ
jgi:hypothetical protein